MNRVADVLEKAVAGGAYSGPLNAAQIVLRCALGWVDGAAAADLVLARGAAGVVTLSRHDRATTLVPGDDSAEALKAPQLLPA